MNKPIRREFPYGRHQVVLETGRLARQADGAALVSIADTVVLATCVARREPDPGRDFFPLTVDYQERTYAAGKIPGGFFRREGRPSEKEILTSRLIDRPLRPLFPKGFRNEVQIIATVLSLDPRVDPDIPALIGASAAVALAGVPFRGPVGAARIGYRGGEFLLNPAFAELETSELDLIVAGTRDSVLMVESEARELPEEIMLKSVLHGHREMQVVIENIRDLAEAAGTKPWEWQAPAPEQQLVEAVEQRGGEALRQAYAVRDKLERRERLRQVRAELLASLAEGEESGEAPAQAGAAIGALERDSVRQTILAGGARIDGRRPDEIREIGVEVGMLPRTHGSALFTRGETQALVVSTIGTDRDSQIVDAIEGEYRDPFMLHYNFPPFCVGETGRMMGPRRREIGHGRLAKRSMRAVMPSHERFPYVIRIVSEITESNGSSSMATVCGASLSLMDAGIPIRGLVAGVAMGLIKEEERFVVLSDIMGDEDHLGDMDFKVAGTAQGVTALQMDIKIDGVSEEVMRRALDQAHEGRMFILERMKQVLGQPREEISKYAPRVATMKINPEKIRDVIGKGGTTIRALTESTGTVINVEDDGTIKIFSSDVTAADKAREQIERLTADIEVGRIYEGRVSKLMDFGAFVNILPGRDGLVHISQISDERVEQVSDWLSEGETVKVKVLEIDRQGRVRLSMKAIQE
ncbi:MAG: polyribonucleotide nucleotidyltransferase [Gammaproteobacteria bacterium]|nr:polyribonucleotide nucleotidyltransferase [Gammaproteobacteria bacterium]